MCSDGDELARSIDLDDPERWPTGTLLAAAGRLVERSWNRRLAGLGITASGVAVLLAVQHGPHSQAELAVTARVSQQSMGRTLDRLERQELIERRPHTSDRRRVLVHQTDAGREALRAALRGHPGEAPVFDRLPNHHRFRADLISLIDLLEADQ